MRRNGRPLPLLRKVAKMFGRKLNLVLGALVLPVLLSPSLSPARAQEAPLATAPIPPPVKAAPDTPMVVPTSPRPAAPASAAPIRPKAATSAAAKPERRPPPRAAQNAPKPPARIKEAERKLTSAARNPARTETKAEAKPEAKSKPEVRTAARARPPAVHRRVVVRHRWIVREERRIVPPPPFGPSWYDRYDRPMAYGPYGGGMRVPPPMPWDE